MTFTRAEIPDIIIIEPTVFGDNRGYFVETYKKDLLEKFISKKIDFVQDNESMSSFGVLRGLHFQIPPLSQTKLVRVTKGEILDVVVDIRKNSPTFGKHISIVLSDKNKKQLLIPQGFAHGFVVLSENAIFNYKVDSKYSPEHERGVKYDDKFLNIDWKIDKDNLILAQKDKLLSSLVDIGDYFSELS